jgi:hypothetical protein
MISLGIPREELYGDSQPPTVCFHEESTAKEEVYPEIFVEGAHAEMLGAEDLTLGDEFEAKVVMRVCRISADEDDEGNKRFSMRIKITHIGEMEAEDIVEEKPEPTPAAGLMLILGREAE